MVKIFVFGIVICIVGSILKQYAKEFVLPFNLAAGAVILLVIINSGLDSVTEFFRNIKAFETEIKLLSGLLKASAIAIVAKLSCDFCHESGNIFFEDIIELGGRIMILLIAMPYIVKIIETALSFAE